jgi:hypothetical protein
MSCTTCSCDPTIAERVERLRALVSGAVVLAQGGQGMERAYGGPLGLRRVLVEQLLKAEGLALDLARATARDCSCSPKGQP